MKKYLQEDFRWAARVEKKLIQELYVTWAEGMIDERLIDEVGISFLVRCKTIRKVTKRICPTCDNVVDGAFESADLDRRISCSFCDWESTWRCYHRSYKKDRIHGGRAFKYFLAFMEKYPLCSTPTQK